MTLMPFYLVWNPARSGPNIQHRTYKEAFAEAERLGQRHPTETFIILRPVSANKPVEKRQWVGYDFEEDI